VVLLLAAGRGSRFGSDKRVSVIEGRETLLYKSLECYRRSGLGVLLCISGRPEDDELEEAFSATGVVCLRCDRADRGMGATLAQGMQACANASAVFIALADMPLVNPDTIARLEHTASPERIVFPVFEGQRGHPVLFGAAFFGELRALDGDRGASAVIQRHSDACIEIPVDDPGVLLDADTPDALADLRRRL